MYIKFILLMEKYLWFYYKLIMITFISILFHAGIASSWTNTDWIKTTKVLSIQRNKKTNCGISYRIIHSQSVVFTNLITLVCMSHVDMDIIQYLYTSMAWYKLQFHVSVLMKHSYIHSTCHLLTHYIKLYGHNVLEVAVKFISQHKGQNKSC